MSDSTNRRILVVDDNPSIHEDFRKILAGGGAADADFDALAGDFFGEAGAAEGSASYVLRTASQGQEALEAVRAAAEAGEPFALAFVDVRMPPGWDGVETIARLWEVDPDLQCVICTAYSDYSYDDTLRKLGRSDGLLILKKPFDPIEVQQIASALTSKWNVARSERQHLEELKAYAASLETVNRALQADKATAEASARTRNDFLIAASRSLLPPAERLVERLDGDDAGRHLAGLDLRDRIAQVGDLAELGCGRRERSPEDIDFPEFARAWLAEAGAACEARGVRLDHRPSGSIPDRLRTDPRLLRSALLGLVVGAAERAEAGEVRVELGGAPDARELLVRLLVPRTSLGPDEDATLLQPFPDAPEPSDVSLHLPHAHRCARVLGAEIRLETSFAAGGAQLVLTLPVAEVPGQRFVEAARLLDRAA